MTGLNLMKKFLIFSMVLYFSFGFSFSLYAYAGELKSFRCNAPNEPHGYINIGTPTFENPDSERCTRKGASLSSIAIIPAFTFIGVPLLIARAVNGGD